MNTKLSAVLIFAIGVICGLGGYHLATRGSTGGKKSEGDAATPSGVSSMLGGSDAEREKEKGAAQSRAIAMPEGFEDVGSVSEIMTKAGPRDRFQALMSFVNSIGEHEIEEALQDLRANMTSQFDPEAMFAMHMLLMRWGEEDSEAAFASLEKLDLTSRAFGSMSVLAAVASKDPRAAADWLTDPKNIVAAFPQAGEFMATTVTKEWAKNDVSAALEWAKTLPEGKRAGAYNGVIGSLASEDPARASAMAMDLEPGKDRTNLVGNIAEAWGKQSPADAIRWVQQMEEGKERDAALGKALGGWAQTEPEKAAAYLDELPDEERAGHVGQVAGSWAQQDPSGAAGWLGDQPEGDSKNDGMRRVMWMWTSTEPEAASTWLAEQPEGPSRDHGIVSLASATFESDPASAITWAAAISDEGMREQHVDRGVNRWMKDEPEAATGWLQGAGQQVLSPEEAQTYLEPPDEAVEQE